MKRTSMCKEYTASRSREGSKPHVSIDADKEFGPVLNIGIATVIDVLGIEMQVPSLSSPGHSVQILTSRGHERFVAEVHRHNSDIVKYSSSLRTKEEKLSNVCFESSEFAVVNHMQGSQDSENMETKVESSSVHRETVASTVRVALGLLEKQHNPMSIHPKAKSSCIKKEISKEDRL